MAETITDADIFNPTIQMPTSGENVSASDLRDKAIQRLANRTNYLSLRSTSIAAYSISGGAVSSGSLFTLAELYDQESIYSVSSNLITVPEIGRYLATLNIYANTTSVAGPAGATARVTGAGTISSSWDSSVSARGAEAGGTVPGYASSVGVLNVTNVGTDTIEVVSAVATGTVTISAESWLILERIS